MTDAPVWDPSEYSRVPTLTLRSSIGLGRAFLASTSDSKETPLVVRKARARLGAVIEKANAALTKRLSAEHRAKGIEPGEVDVEADQSWGAFRMRLEAYALLPQPKNPRVARSRELVQVLFGGEGLVFLTLPYVEQLSEMESRLAVIDEEELRKELETLVGKEFVEQIHKVQPQYAKMVRDLLTRDEESSENLLAHLRSMQRNLQWFVSAVVGQVDPEDGDSVAAAHKTLLPLRNYRDRAAKRQTSGGEGEGEGEGKEGGAAPKA